ncbi:MAG: hypothetical protein AB1801_00925 [Chloroflexota bacterium]
MFKQLRRIHSEDMALILWLCSLPLVALFVIPFFGSRRGLNPILGDDDHLLGHLRLEGFQMITISIFLTIT